jgi:hypothetical protein
MTPAEKQQFKRASILKEIMKEKEEAGSENEEEIRRKDSFT